MEDDHICIPILDREDMALFAVFDGHRGTVCSLCSFATIHHSHLKAFGYRKKAHLGIIAVGNLTAANGIGRLIGVTGNAVAKICGAHFATVLITLPEFRAGNYKAALEKAFFTMDELVRQEAEKIDMAAIAHTLNELHDEPPPREPPPDHDEGNNSRERSPPMWVSPPNKERNPYAVAGCTAVVALVVGRNLYVAGAGDARAGEKKEAKRVLIHTNTCS